MITSRTLEEDELMAYLAPSEQMSDRVSTVNFRLRNLLGDQPMPSQGCTEPKSVMQSFITCEQGYFRFLEEEAVDRHEIIYEQSQNPEVAQGPNVVYELIALERITEENIPVSHSEHPEVKQNDILATVTLQQAPLPASRKPSEISVQHTASVKTIEREEPVPTENMEKPKRLPARKIQKAEPPKPTPRSSKAKAKPQPKKEKSAEPPIALPQKRSKTSASKPAKPQKKAVRKLTK